MAIKLHDEDKYPMMKSLNADPRLLGLEASLAGFIQFTSAQRACMSSSNLVQALVIDKPEMRNVASGYEREFMEYTFNPSRMPQNGTTIAVIPKYRANAGSNPIKSTPSYTLIYKGQEDNMIHSLEVPTYMRGIDGFGYLMDVNQRMLIPDLGLSKGDCISKSKACEGSRYMLGTNANVAYISMKETVEDAFCISESLAKRMESTGIKTLTIDIGKNDVPLNLYGDIDNYKICPDIGEYINPDGIILGLRQANDNTIIADMNELALTIPQYQHDELYYAAAPEAVVLDIDVWVNENRKVRTPEKVFSQFQKYIDGNRQYYKRIFEIYEEECLRKKQIPAPEFITLVERAASMMTAYQKGFTSFGLSRKTPPKFSRKSEVIKFIQLQITYAFKYKVSPGMKLVGVDGSKGVISRVIKDEDCVVNDYGERADMCIAPEAVINRMNLGQLYEQFLNVCISKIIRDIKSGVVSHLEAYDYILEFIRDVNPDYADVVEKVIDNRTNKKEEFVREAIEKEQIIIVVPSFLETLTPEWCIKMEEKYGTNATPVEYNLRDEDGNLIRRVRTIKPIYIGKKYLFILCKIPYGRACAVSYVNQYKIPIRTKERKVKEGYPVGLTPIRLGEDEVRNLTMMIGEDITSRVLAIYANNPEATDKLVETLLTKEDPTNIPTIFADASALEAGNQTIKVFNHLMHTVGVDAINTKASKEEIEKLSTIEDDFEW